MGRPRPREVTGIANLGPIDIVLESLKLFWSHAKFFLLIQVTLVLPIVILGLLEQLVLAHFQSGPNLPPPPPYTLGLVTGASGGHDGLRFRRHFNFRAVLPTNNSPDPLPIFLTVGIVIVSAIFSQVLQSLWIGAVLYAVGLIYTGNSVGFVDVLHKIPYLWKRVFVTLLWQLLLVFGITFLDTVVGVGVFHFLEHSILISSLILIPMSLLSVWLLVGISLVGEVAQSVSVLEDSYGWTALKKSTQLLKGNRWWVAFLVVVLWAIPGTALSYLMTKITAQYSVDPWNPLMWLVAVIYVLCSSIFTELNCVSWGVMYASFKAYHGQSIGDSSFFRETVTKDIDEHDQGLLSGSENEP